MPDAHTAPRLPAKTRRADASPAELRLCESLWAIETVAGQRLEAHLAAHPEALARPRVAAPPLAQRDGPLAVISIQGVLTKHGSRYGEEYGGTSTAAIAAAVEAAARDDSVQAILLEVDSPGGSVDGIPEAADAILAARQKKPVVAQTIGLNCSAALYLSSQADKLFAQRMDYVGSIGVRMVLVDASRYFANAGVDIIPVDTGAYKSAGTFGTKVTEAHKAYFQKLVDEFAADFKAAIGRGRNLPAADVEALADGRVFLASEAARMKLIDGVQTPSATREQLLARLSSTNPAAKPSPGAKRMSAATYQEIKAACPGADPQFLCEELEKGVDASQAAKDWMTLQALRLEEAEKKLAASAAAAKPVAAPPVAPPAPVAAPGVKPVPAPGAAAGGRSCSARDEFFRQVAEYEKSGLPRQQAVRRASREQPELQAEMIAEANQK